MICKLVLVLATATAAFGTPVKMHHTRNFSEGGKIWGGTEATEGEIPFMVSVQSKISSFPECGGTIISEDFVITTAICCTYTGPIDYQIRAGTVTLKTGGTVHNISEMIMHEGFDAPSKLNDICLMRMNPPFSFDSNTAAAALPAQGTDTPAGTMITISGWGTRYSGAYPYNEDLIKVDMSIVDTDVCNEKYSGYGGLVPNQICAGVEGGGEGPCGLDFGGPLFKDGVLLGILCRRVHCGVVNYPGVSMEVSAYRDWITANSGI